MKTVVIKVLNNDLVTLKEFRIPVGELPPNDNSRTPLMIYTYLEDVRELTGMQVLPSWSDYD